MMPKSTRALRLPVHLVLLALLATLIPLLMATTAEASPPKPNTPKFGKAIEGYAPYEGNTVCDPVEQARGIENRRPHPGDLRF